MPPAGQRQQEGDGRQYRELGRRSGEKSRISASKDFLLGKQGGRKNFTGGGSSGNETVCLYSCRTREYLLFYNNNP